MFEGDGDQESLLSLSAVEPVAEESLAVALAYLGDEVGKPAAFDELDDERSLPKLRQSCRYHDKS